ncbi:MAG: hypothetical protein LBI13_10175 [Streptococcaceae bacterium]|jgi:hypothetical protein|nr:hypothetical protein [Streptococcaceae bacterium]
MSDQKKKDRLIEEQLLEEKKLSNRIESGELALVKYQEMSNLIEDTAYNLGKNLEVLDKETVQLSFQKMQLDRQEMTQRTNQLLGNMNENLLQMKRKHEREREEFEK